MPPTPTQPERLPLPPLPDSTSSSLRTGRTDDDDDMPTPSPSPSPSPRPFSRTAATGQRASLGVASLNDPESLSTYAPRRISQARPSFSTLRSNRTRRASRASRVGPIALDDDDDAPKLPTLVPGIRPAYSTPLPVLPITVLCIAMLSELLSANLSQPFMLKMVERFFLDAGNPPSSQLEADAALWTGNLVSAFYITQFFTSLLWSGIADRHGRRAVLVASMTGSGLALLMFGTSTSLPEAICVRLIQGIFGGAIGVFRGSIRDITDDTNATRAYAMLGFCWGLGGVIGPIIGGVFENPADNFAGTFLGRIKVFQRLPYFLPTLLGGSIMFIGAILSCFLSWDGGVRGGSRIQLEMEKDEPLVPARTDSASPVPASNQTPASSAMRIHRPSRLFTPAPETPLGQSVHGQSAFGTSAARMRHDSMASLGTAYGYGGIRSKHPTLAARRAIEAARRASAVAGHGDNEEDDPRRVSLATKFLLANDDNTFNINDLWLSAAVAQDTAVFDDDDEYDEGLDDDEALDDRESLAPTERDDTPLQSTNVSPNRARGYSTLSRSGRGRAVSGASGFSRFRAPSMASRRYSNSSAIVPSIFSNMGVSNTPGIAAFEDDAASINADPFSPPNSATVPRRPGAPTALTAIHERGTSSSPATTIGGEEEKPVSRWKLLPLLVICQYGLLSCHDSTHGQIFLSFVITPYPSGGVGLSPANYSVFVAIMCLGQLVYQFYLFPRLGPPLGRFSHLQMFRLGAALFIPGYLLVPLIRSTASPDNPGSFITMTATCLISAIRYCGGTFAYTSIMILINAMTPPHLIGLANGLAQSTVSCARFFGPALGGAIWSASINGNPNGYASGFYTVTMFAIVQVLGSFFIR